jgi:serpin B
MVVIRMKKWIASLFAVSFLFMTAGCGTGDNTGGLQISKDVEFGENDYKKLTSANNQLGFDLLSKVRGDQNGNKFISPTSVLQAISMVYNGADGGTKEEIAKALHVEGIDVKELNKASASLMNKLHQDSKRVKLNIANSIWINNNYHFQTDFKQNTEDYFNAKIEEINIMDRESPKKINDWVRKSTNGKIDEIVDSPLDSDLVAILINAIYFKGEWIYEFDKKRTEKRPFFLENGAIKEISLMTLNEDLDYYENESFQAVSLPYGDEKMSMKVFLPKENLSLQEFEKKLTEKNWQEWNSQFHKKEGTILLPKFQLEYEVNLNDPLKKLGMVTAFDFDEANFRNMIEEADPLWISQVKHKTFIDVNEEGTEAAAATSVEMKTESAPADGPFYMEINRPFFVSIVDEKTGMILFVGFISNPQEKGV